MAQREIVAALVLGLLGACGGGQSNGGSPLTGTGDGGTTTPVTGSFVADGAVRLTGALCAHAARCGLVASEVACVTTPALLPAEFDSPDALVLAVTNGQLDVVDAEADRCIAAIRTLPCGTTRRSPLRVPVCEAAFTGRVLAGATCTTDLVCETGAACLATGVTGACVGLCTRIGPGQCARDVDCVQGQACQRGQCTTVRTAAGALGEACGSLAPCAAGLACVQVSPTSFRCEEARGVGGPCALSLGPTQCAPGFVCSPTGTTGLGTCVERRGLGEPCTELLSCGGIDSNLVCDPRVGACVRRPVTGPCFFFGTAGLCDASAFCDVSVTPALCRPRATTTGCFSDLDCGFGTGLRCIGFGPTTPGACLAGTPSCTPTGP